MSVRKGSYIPALRPADEVVSELLEESNRRFEELRLSPDERRALNEKRRKEKERLEKSKKKAESQKANRVLTYLPVELREQIEQIASEQGVSMAQVMTFFLFEATSSYGRGEIGFWGHKYESESPRYEWNLVHPKDTERMEKIQLRKIQKTRRSG